MLLHGGIGCRHKRIENAPFVGWPPPEVDATILKALHAKVVLAFEFVLPENQKWTCAESLDPNREHTSLGGIEAVQVHIGGLLSWLRSPVTSILIY